MPPRLGKIYGLKLLEVRFARKTGNSSGTYCVFLRVKPVLCTFTRNFYGVSSTKTSFRPYSLFPWFLRYSKKMEQIYGKLTDSQGRCVHYHTQLDIIANRCSRCNKLYACYKCHDETEDHSFSPVYAMEPKTVMCGACGKYFSYIEYKTITACPDCGLSFNPGCSKHECIYSKK